MQLEDKLDSSSNFPAENPSLDSSSAKENTHELLSPEEVVLPIPKVKQNVSQKRQHTFHWDAVKVFLYIFFISYGINWIRFSLAPSIVALGSCGSMAKQFEGKYKIGTINRAQQTYFVENQKFTENLQQLGVGIKYQEKNYNYSIRTTNKAVFNYALFRSDAYKLRTSYFGPFWWDYKEPLQMKSYVGAVFAIPPTNLDSQKNKKEMTTLAIVCEVIKPVATIPSSPTLVKGVPTCGANTKDLNKL